MNKAFTLIEMLVAIAVSLLLLGILAVSLSGVELATRQVNSRLGACETARAALDWIGRDLERMRPMVPGSLWSVTAGINTNVPAATNGPQFLIVTSASAILNSSITVPHASFWQVVSDQGTGRSMASVGYFVRWIQDGATLRPTLCRLYVPQSSADYGNLYTNGTAWLNNTLLSNYAPGTAPTYQGWFADNVFSIWFRALDSNGNPITTNAASVAFPGGSFDSRQGYLSGTNQVEGPALPASLEVAVVVVDGGRLYGNAHAYTPALGLGSTPASFWSDIQTSMADSSIPRNIRDGLRVYSTRIPIRFAQ